ncbi:MAG: hypothetical protein K0Q66_745 [Chitinophagaceae bacterium]|nr:hypothetical protein [Chitinophagaceae bacterium]
MDLVTVARLLDLFVYGYFLQVRVELFEFDTLGRVLFVLHRDVTAGTRNTRILLLGTFEDNLDPVAFLCHRLNDLWIFDKLDFYSLSAHFLDHNTQTTLVDGADGISGEL